jgi:hypothetical protein
LPEQAKRITAREVFIPNKKSMSALKAAGLESVRTIPFNPTDKASLSFREHDLKFLSLRPDLEHWVTVLTKQKPWDEKGKDGKLLNDSDTIKNMKETNRLAVTAYVLSLGGEALTYARDQEFAYDIREGLKNRYLGSNRMHLAKLQYEYNTYIRKNKRACPDQWFSELNYMSKKIADCGYHQKTKSEIIQDIITMVPKEYDVITTFVTTMDISVPEAFKTVNDYYTN